MRCRQRWLVIGAIAFFSAVQETSAENYFVTSSGRAADLWVRFTTNGGAAEEWWFVDKSIAASKVDTWIIPTDSSGAADLWVIVTSNPKAADKIVCLGGDLELFWQHADRP